MAAKKADFRQSTAAMFLTLQDEDVQEQSPIRADGTQFYEIPIAEISDFPDHPFKVRQDEAMLNTVESIRQNGVRQPAIIRPLPEGGYQMVSGHRRKAACEIVGLATIPAIIREMDDDEAIICMVESNHQRENILPSEHAAAYKMQLEAMRRQAGRPAMENGVPLDTHSLRGKSRDIVASQSGESAAQVQRYIRLTELIEPILQMVDDKKIAFRPAVELSYLPQALQTELLEVMEANECTPSLSQAQRMKQAAQESKLDRNGMELVMQEEKPQQNNITIKASKLEKYFPKNSTPKEREDMIIKALDMYCRVLERKRQERERAER